MVAGISTITIRPANMGDTSALAAILRQLGWFEHINAEPEQATEARVKENLIRCMAGENDTVLVAQNADGGIAGYIAVHWMPNLMSGLDGYVSQLFVGPVKGHGVGTGLLDAVEREAVTRGCKRLLLFNRSIRESYRRGFYHKRGWEEHTDAAIFMRYLSD
jgi:GNAT superfamily N-acetyltransferase